MKDNKKQEKVEDKKNVAEEENLADQLEKDLENGEKAEETSNVNNFQKEAEEYKDKWMRSVAEFDNYKKRNASLYSDAFFEGKKEAVSKILSIGDNLETAIGMITDEKTKEGIEKLLKQFNSVLEGMGVTAVDPVGTEFNPDTAEAVMQVEPQDEQDKSGFVKMTFRKGYKLQDKMIRYAQVSVIK